VSGPKGDHDRVEEAASWILRQVHEAPAVALILGSGLGTLADRLADAVAIPYRQVPHFPIPTVLGHAGELVIGRMGSTPLAAFRGRFHYYEGHDLASVTFPVRVARALGARTLILTAATGGIRPEHRAGDLACLSDHLNLLGVNPLRGPNDHRLGPRFPDMTAVYSARLRAIAHQEADRLGLKLGEAVYAALPGPSYETPAEIRMLRTLGADVVGMSTVPEAIVARHGGLEVLAFALITNAAAGITGAPITHAEVLAAGAEAGRKLGDLIEAIVARLGERPG